MAAISIGAPVPDADPEAFLNLGAVAIPAITGSALIDGLLLGKVAFLKGRCLASKRCMAMVSRLTLGQFCLTGRPRPLCIGA